MVKIELQVKDIKEDLQIAGLLSSKSKTITDITGNLEFRVKNKKIAIVATNYQQTFKSVYDVNIAENIMFNYYLNTNEILNAVRKFKSGTFTIEFLINSNKAILTHNKFVLELDIILVRNSIVYDKFDSEFNMNIDVNELKELTSMMKIFTSPSIFDILASGIWLKKEGDNSLFVMTDKKTVYLKKIKENLPDGFNVVIPNKLFETASVHGEGDVVLSVADKYSSFKFGNKTITSRNFSHPMPLSMRKFIDMFKATDLDFSVNLKEFNDAIDILMPFRDNSMMTLELFFNQNNSLKMVCEKASIEIDYSSNGSFPESIKVNIVLLKDFLKINKEESVTLKLNVKKKSLTYTSIDQEVDAVIMLKR